MNNQAISAARQSITAAVQQLATREIADTGIRPLAISDAPDTWEALQSVDLSAGLLPIWDGASDASIYNTAAGNHLFRYWHDMGHLQHGLSFTPDDERTLQHDWHLPAVAAIVGRDSLPYRLYAADTLGQIDYVVAHKRFPQDQLAFSAAYVVDRARALDTVY